MLTSVHIEILICKVYKEVHFTLCPCRISRFCIILTSTSLGFLAGTVNVLSITSSRALPSSCLKGIHCLSTHSLTHSLSSLLLPAFSAHHCHLIYPAHHLSKKSALSGILSAALEIRAWLQIPCAVNKTPFSLPL